jgi:hypothetical protein
MVSSDWELSQREKGKNINNRGKEQTFLYPCCLLFIIMTGESISRVCQILLDKSCVLPTSKKICQVKKSLSLTDCQTQI